MSKILIETSKPSNPRSPANALKPYMPRAAADLKVALRTVVRLLEKTDFYNRRFKDVDGIGLITFAPDVDGEGWSCIVHERQPADDSDSLGHEGLQSDVDGDEDDGFILAAAHEK